MDEVVKESTSFLVAEESKQLSFTSHGHYQISPLHRDDLDFETDIPKEATLHQTVVAFSQEPFALNSSEPNKHNSFKILQRK